MERLRLAIMEFVCEGIETLKKEPVPIEHHERVEEISHTNSSWEWRTWYQDTPDMGALYYKFIWDRTPLKSSEPILAALIYDQELQSRLYRATRMIEGWRESQEHLRSTAWKLFLGPYLEKYWGRYEGVRFDQRTFDEAWMTMGFHMRTFDEVWNEYLALLPPPSTHFETTLSPLTLLNIGQETIELEPGLIIRPLKHEEIESWLNGHYLLPDTEFRFEEISHLQCAIVQSYHSPFDNLSSDGIKMALWEFAWYAPYLVVYKPNRRYPSKSR